MVHKGCTALRSAHVTVYNLHDLETKERSKRLSILTGLMYYTYIHLLRRQTSTAAENII